MNVEEKVPKPASVEVKEKEKVPGADDEEMSQQDPEQVPAIEEEVKEQPKEDPKERSNEKSPEVTE